MCWAGVMRSELKARCMSRRGHGGRGGTATLCTSSTLRGDVVGVRTPRRAYIERGSALGVGSRLLSPETQATSLLAKPYLTTTKMRFSVFVLAAAALFTAGVSSAAGKFDSWRVPFPSRSDTFPSFVSSLSHRPPLPPPRPLPALLHDGQRHAVRQHLPAGRLRIPARRGARRRVRLERRTGVHEVR